MKKDSFYLYGYVNDSFVVIGLDVLGEIYQEEDEKNIELFTNETDEVKLKTFESYKDDSIYFGNKEEWKIFYNNYKNKYIRRGVNV